VRDLVARTRQAEEAQQRVATLESQSPIGASIASITPRRAMLRAPLGPWQDGDASMRASMTRHDRVALAGAAVLGVSLVLAAAALAASAFTDVYDYYRQHPKVDPCHFSEQTLQQAKSEVPPGIQRYAPYFPAALEAFLEAHARGACIRARQHVALPATAVAGAGVVTPPSAPGVSAPASTAVAPAATPAPPRASAPITAVHASSPAKAGASTAPAPLIAIAVLAALLALGSAAFAFARWRAWDPEWAQSASHALSEAGYRMEATWAEFSDWLRLGR
jgi:hypothetical protein